MSSLTLLELTRSAHEEVERLERLIVNDLQNELTSNKNRLYQSHRVRNIIHQITSTTRKLINIYEDKDNARKDEIADETATSVFYDRVNEIIQYHRSNPSARVMDATDDYEQLLKQEPLIEFSGEEAYGRYLYLHELFNDYINSKFGDKLTDYSSYLQIFSLPHNIPRILKSNTQYREYLNKLLEYLILFVERSEPLQDLERLFSKVTTEFEEQWASGSIEGWENDGLDQHNVINLDYYSNVEELLEVGPEKLKEALAALGLKTGGTVQERAERLFLTKHIHLEKMDKKHFAKGVPRHQGEDSKEIALVETKIEKLCELLQETITRTRENVVKKYALTYEEIEAEREEEQVQADINESEDEEETIYNPLKLPMGGDGNVGTI